MAELATDFLTANPTLLFFVVLALGYLIAALKVVQEVAKSPSPALGYN